MKSENKHLDLAEQSPKITVFGVGGAGSNAINNMMECGLTGVDFVVANTDSQALLVSKCPNKIQIGQTVTNGLGAGAVPEIGREAAEESEEEILKHLVNYHMVFITAGMGGGTGTGAAPVIAKLAKQKGILTVGVVTKPFHFEGVPRMRIAEEGIKELEAHVDTLIVIPNQNLFRIANEKTSFTEAFKLADQVLYAGVASITDLMLKSGLINLDFADVRSVMVNMGRAVMGTGEATGEGRALKAAEAAIVNPLLDETCMKGARGLLISISGGNDMTLYEVDEATNRIREEVDNDAQIIFGAIADPALEGSFRVSVVATGLPIDKDKKTIEPQLFNNKAGSNSKKSDQVIDKAKTSRNSTQARIVDPMAITNCLDNDTKPQNNIETSAKKHETPAAFNEAQLSETAPQVDLSFNLDKLQFDMQADLENSMANLDGLSSFSNLVRHNLEAAKSGLAPKSPVVKLWQKLKENIGYKTDNVEIGSLQPKEAEFFGHDIKKKPSTSALFAKDIKAAPVTRYNNEQHSPLMEADELEIPAFLRRHIN